MDGINRHILTVSRALCKRGVDVAVCIAQSGGEFAAALKAVGVPAYSLNARNGHDMRILWRLCKIMREFKPDIVHIHVLPFMARVLFSVKYGRIKFVSTTHGISDPIVKMAVRDGIGSFLSKLFRLNILATCYVSKGVMKACGNEGDRIKEVIYNPVDDCVHKRNLLRLELGLGDCVPIVGTACRIAAVKSPDAFVAVMMEVLRKVPMAHAVVLGAGDPVFERQMRDVVSNSGMSSRFHLLGYRPNSAELIADFDCFVMTSQREGMPTALLEAMMSRTSIAFWKGEGGLQDLVAMNEQSGPFALVAENGDISGLADGIVGLISDKKRKEDMINIAFDVCKSNFSVDAVIPKMINAYNKICQ